MQSITLQARRCIKDYIAYKGGLANVKVNADMLGEVWQARTRYDLYLEEQKKLSGEASAQKKRKKVSDELAAVRLNIESLIEDEKKLRLEADRLSYEAVQATDNSVMREFLVQSNCLRKGADQKRDQIQVLRKKETELVALRD